MPYTETDRTCRKLSLISGHAERAPKFRFTSLAHLLDEEFLTQCFYCLNRNKAIGIDRVSWKEYGENLGRNIESLVGRLKSKRYKPIPAKRVYIPKNGMEKRPLGISALENKIVESAISRILGSIYEQDFLECSYGFRPKRSCHQALRGLNDIITFKPVNHVVEADIKGFFDNVSHEKLMDFLRIRIADSSLLSLIEKFLKAGYIDDTLLVRTHEGTPQGSILSPILANVFLHYVLDIWFKETVKSHIKGYCELVRYADDFVVMVQSAEESRRIEKALKNRFGRYELELHPAKSRNISFGRKELQNAEKQNRRANTFDFLGFTHFCDVSRKGRFKLGRRTSRKRYAAKCRDMNDWLRRNRNELNIKDLWKILCLKLRGHIQYYGVSENSHGVTRFYRQTIESARKWLSRRSQRGKMSLEKFREYLKNYPLPKPKIVHSFYTMRKVSCELN